MHTLQGLYRFGSASLAALRAAFISASFSFISSAAFSSAAFFSLAAYLRSSACFTVSPRSALATTVCGGSKAPAALAAPSTPAAPRLNTAVRRETIELW